MAENDPLQHRGVLGLFELHYCMVPYSDPPVPLLNEEREPGKYSRTFLCLHGTFVAESH